MQPASSEQKATVPPAMISKRSGKLIDVSLWNIVVEIYYSLLICNLLSTLV